MTARWQELMNAAQREWALVKEVWIARKDRAKAGTWTGAGAGFRGILQGYQ